MCVDKDQARVGKDLAEGECGDKVRSGETGMGG